MRLLLAHFFTFFSTLCFSQSIESTKINIQKLCSDELKGRGYVEQGVNKAAKYLVKEFENLNLKKFNNSYIQTYTFPVNTFPYPISCELDNKPKKVGIDFLVAADATKINGNYNLIFFNTKDSLDITLLSKKINKGFEKNEALVLRFDNARKSNWIDTCKKYYHFPELIIFTEEKKLTHTVATQTSEYNSLIFLDSVVLNKDKIHIQFQNEFHPSFENKNIIGFINGKKKDSFIVFSAHYDHLGMQGDAMFPGASDNASGTSMLLYLANYFSKHKPIYNLVFIFFSGEEAGLKGSEYFVNNPTFDIKKIKTLINIDIMGDAKNGITVVNGEVYKNIFDKLTALNKKSNLIPEIKIRGKAKNSDHYYFGEKGIPSVFIYSMGGVGYYHDVFDKAETLSLTNFANVAQLLIDFVQSK